MVGVAAATDGIAWLEAALLLQVCAVVVPVVLIAEDGVHLSKAASVVANGIGVVVTQIEEGNLGCKAAIASGEVLAAAAAVMVVVWAASTTTVVTRWAAGVREQTFDGRELNSSISVTDKTYLWRHWPVSCASSSRC